MIGLIRLSLWESLIWVEKLKLRGEKCDTVLTAGGVEVCTKEFLEQ